jgi:hypothetical protein
VSRRAVRAVLAVLVYSASVLPMRIAHATDLPPQQQALLVLRILSYDRNLKARAETEVAIAVVSGSLPCEEIVVALESASKQRSVAGLPVRVVPMAWPKDGNLKLDKRPAAAYICGGLSGQVDKISALTRQRDILSIAGTEADVKSGLGIGFALRNDRAAVVVNLNAVKEEGAELDSALLSLAEIVGK